MITIRAPARLCLLGEHQDYFGLGVISGAIGWHLTVEAEAAAGGRVRIELPDIGRRTEFEAARRVVYIGSRDYLRAGWNVAAAAGWDLPEGVSARVRSEIPIAKGASSSSALTVAWMAALAALAGRAPAPEELAWLAYRAEVLEFGEPGGMQDHFAIAAGGLIHLDCRPPVRLTALAGRPRGLILADSGATKETVGTLARIKGAVQRALARMGGPDLPSLEPAAAAAAPGLPEDERQALAATLIGRDLTAAGRRLLEQPVFDAEHLAGLINAHHAALRDGLDVSTPAIERLGRAARAAGALAFKVLGSGGGGLLLAYAPDDPERVVAALERAGGRARVVRLVGGAGPV